MSADNVSAALWCIPSEDRDIWLRCAMAIKSELGEDGFDLWDQWSAQADSYKPKDAKTVWRSVKAGGGITIRSLFAIARQHGYEGHGAQPTPRYRVGRETGSEASEAPLRALRQRQAAHRAQKMIREAHYGRHPYLAARGFPETPALVLGGLLLVPMRDVRTQALTSLQTIDASGRKQFLAGGRTKGCVFVLGRGPETVCCEGYATALSVRAALQALYRPARVVVCFCAHNLAHVARQMRADWVVADHDEAGVNAARKTGLPWWQPPTAGMDANDVYQQAGVAALCDAWRGGMSPRQRGQSRDGLAGFNAAHSEVTHAAP